jgi:ABC-type Na+ efflux pump permease subunit
MRFASPLLTEPVRAKVIKTGRILALVVAGLFVFSILYVLLTG